MAGGQERTLRRRIKSVQATKKITRAMELIAASRISKAQDRVAAAQPYAEGITNVIRNLAAGGARFESKLLQPPERVSTVAFVVIAADRGLAGAYNSNVIRAAERALLAEQREGRDYVLFTVGRKAQSYFRFRGYRITESYTGVSDTPTYDDAKAIADDVLERYEGGEVELVRLAYTRFVSIGTQRVEVEQYMPLELGEVRGSDTEAPAADYEYEPDPTEILDRLLPRYAEARLFAALLDAAASQHVAQQRAMKAATDNAEDLIVRYTRAMNRARQDAITTEIMEIVGGAEALRQAGVSEDEAPDLSDLEKTLTEQLDRT